MPEISDSPPRAPPIKYTAPLGTRWAKEMAAAGGASAFDLPTDPKQIGPWILGECVGKGASGRVKIAKHRRTGQLAAVKILPVAPVISSRASLATQQAKSDKQRLGIDREITMMKLMKHPNIMRIYDVYEGENELFLVLEYIEGGELFDFLVNRGRLPPHEALQYFKQIVYGLNYAHTFSIIHRDLKPENILIASLTPPLIKIADWGMAAFAPPSLQLETSCGSPHYASPEIVNGEKYQGNATDIWSCGVILFALLTGRLPFDDKNVRTLLSKVKSGKFDMPPWVDPLAKDLLTRMLVVDVKKRITIPEILSHPWLMSPITIAKHSAKPIILTAPTPPLPPSPSILARPISSPDLIDSELLDSLRIIWGRHTDSQGESIKRDLCSPVGCGVHAKAFYFLLGMYREESSRSRLEDGVKSATEMNASLKLGSFKFNLAWELDHSGVKKYEVDGGILRGLNRHTAPAPMSLPRSVLVTRGRTVTESSLSHRPASPVGPRPPHAPRTSSDLRKSQVASLEASINSPRPTAPVGIGRGGPRPLPRRGYTYSAVPTSSRERKNSVGTSPLGFTRNLQYLHVMSPPPLTESRAKLPAGPSTTDMAKRALTTSASDSHLEVSNDTPHISLKNNDAEGCGNADTPDQSPTGSSQNRSHDMSKQQTVLNNALEKDVDTNLMDAPNRPPGVDNNYEKTKSADHKIPSRPFVDDDKENRSTGEDGWSYIASDDGKVGTVGLCGGRDNENIIGPLISPAKSKKVKDKKSRPPPLELHSVNQRRYTVSTLESPINIASPIHHAPSSSSRLVSPVVGEFKGWFSNLFSWKTHQTIVFYSGHDFCNTRLEVGKLLESLGVVFEGSGSGSGSGSGVTDAHNNLSETLKCHVDQTSNDPPVKISLKPVRFRVEFLPLSSDSSMDQPLSPTESPYFMASPNSNYLVTPNPGITPRARSSILMSRNPVHSTPLPSPNIFTSGDLPPGCVCAFILTHEKGSMSSFKTVWKKLKEGFTDSTATPFSPVMPATPIFEQPQRLAL